MSNVKTTIAILNFNGLKLLESYLPSIVEYCPKDTYICVIDNFSTDGSCTFIETHYPNLQLIQLDKNYGYAGGYNEGLKSIATEFVALINSDIMVDHDWLSPIIQYMEKHREIGACQPKIKSLKEPHKFEYAGAAGGWIDQLGYPFCKGRIFDTVETDHHQYDDAGPIFWASGAAFVVRKQIFDEAGGFDRDFFAHMEEIDLCWRIQKMGHQIHTYPQSYVFHLGGGTLSYQNERKTYLNFRNSLFMLMKNQASKNLLFVLLTRMILDGISGLKFLLEGKPKFLFAIVRAHFSFYGNIPSLLKKRKRIKQYSNRDEKIFGKFNASIVYAYFINKVKTFSELNINN